MNINQFDYFLPPELIAQEPVFPRSSSRLLILDRTTKKIEHRIFRDIIEYIPPEDMIVFNRSKVINARLFVNDINAHNNKKLEIFFLEQLSDKTFKAIVRPGKKFKKNKEFKIILDTNSNQIHDLSMHADKITIKCIDICDDGNRIFEIISSTSLSNMNFTPLFFFQTFGNLPLPPYISSNQKIPNDRYQTVFAKEEGSVAAPTAGLHFDEELLEKIKNKGISIGEIVLHVGIGTFKPIQTTDITQHKIHKERFFIDNEFANKFKDVRAKGGKIWAVGTTTVRTLETAYQEDGSLITGWHETDCYIYPGYKFKCIDHLITNFHLPRSTLLVLVSAFAGRDLIMQAYQEAINQKYRFYSFGDAMLIL